MAHTATAFKRTLHYYIVYIVHIILSTLRVLNYKYYLTFNIEHIVCHTINARAVFDKHLALYRTKNLSSILKEVYVFIIKKKHEFKWKKIVRTFLCQKCKAKYV